MAGSSTNKKSHYAQFPPETEAVASYVESRGGRFPRTLFFGAQMFAREYLSRPITRDMIEEATDFNARHMPASPFNREGWDYTALHAARLRGAGGQVRWNPQPSAERRTWSISRAPTP